MMMQSEREMVTMIRRWALTMLAICLFCHSSVSQEQSSVDKALMYLREICQASKAQSIEGGLDGDVSFKDVAGKIGLKLKFATAEVFGLADKLTGAEALKENGNVRDCMVKYFPAMVKAAAPRKEGPIVVLMDSVINNYSEGAKELGLSNADYISPTLSLIEIGSKEAPTHIRSIKETTGIQWNREADVLNLKPALVIIHF